MISDASQSRVRVNSSKDLAGALNNAAPGMVIQLAPGCYREPVRLTCSGTAEYPIRFEAEQKGTAIFNGAVPVREWTYVRDDIWVTEFEVIAKQNWVDEFGHIGLPVQVWVGDLRLEIVEIVEELVENSFCHSDGRLWVKLPKGMNAQESEIEVAKHATMVEIAGSHIEFAGIVVTRCASTVQVGGLLMTGPNNVIEDCEFSEAAGGIGAHFDGDFCTVRRNFIHHNGQMGFAMVASNCLFEENHVHMNDLRNFCSNPKNNWHVWECGGGKVAYSRDSVFRRNRFTDNLRGPALWFDIDNYRNRIEGNYFSNNGHSSIMIEISRDNLICNNIICDARESNYCSAGILIQLSSNTRIYHNLFLRSEGYGVYLRWHLRSRDIHPYEPEDPDEFEKVHGFRQELWMAPDGQYPTKENDIRNNLFIDCRRGAIHMDLKPDWMTGNTSDYNFFWNAHNLHPMDGGHQLAEWTSMTGLDEHSYYDKMAHFGPLLRNDSLDEIAYDPQGPIPEFKVPCLDAVPNDINGATLPDMTLAGPFVG